MHMIRTSAIAVVASLLAVSQANAVPVFVDFTNAASWSGAAGQSTYTSTYGSVDVTLSVLSGQALSFNAGDAHASTSQTGAFAMQGDGIGIGNDEIGVGESLGVSFSSPVTVLSFALLDLFTGEGPGNASEQFLADFGGAGSLSGAAAGLDSAGFYQSGALGLGGVGGITFSSLGGSWSDFALAGIWFDIGVGTTLYSTTVPEPGAVWMLGSAMLLLALVGRRKRRYIRK